ncbi:uncharacterized protein LACBIDRAFT_316809 [Laccaria bicolor S238N-H82]|uniref:Predicted protein n=1 Tax=Laccaria bicolor (strain S238N-H82 / ATCC MYA-4686) TaxID=486041 RepID=B0E1N6_LACBS|nr:uncharacterized protein LACBIDRAFT_316809 [Laccaria bicolor S238N-H82]EDQ99206.1 predicted protein [Laccaria bicolor S238N-H82]|eukprot:XP_001890103.1 predicted protein [Laccaria bicolor S238N-H82]
MVKSLLTAITTTVAMDGSINDEIQGIEEDIRQIAVDNPHLAKWFMATPELMQKKRKQKEKKDKKKVSKAALKTTNSTPLPSSSHVEEPADDLSTHSSDDDDDKQSTEKENERPAKKTKTLTNITAYIEINRPPRTLKDKPEPLSRGPFFFTLSTPRIEFLQSLASCSVEGSYAPTIASINQEQLFWKQQVPANDKKKPLTNEVGYKAMIAKLEELTKKGKDTTITLSLPPLSKVAAMPSDTTAGTRGVDLEREEFREGPLGSTIREQQQVVCEGTSAFLEKLRLKYPIGSDPRFPDKRVYSSGSDVWELNGLRLQVWASHLDKGTASLTEPPNSTHFAQSQRLRITTAATIASNSVDAAVPPTPVPQPALNQQFQPYGSYPHPHYFPPPYPYPMLPLYNPHPANNVYPNQYPDAPHPAPAPFLNVPLNPTHAPNLNHAYAQGVRPRTPGILRDAAPGSAPGSPLKVILPHPISLEEFCIHYAVDNEDQA